MLGVCFLLIVISVFAVVREFIAMICFKSHIPSSIKTAKPSLTISLPPLYSTVVKSDSQGGIPIQGPPAYEFDSTHPLNPDSQV